MIFEQLRLQRTKLGGFRRRSLFFLRFLRLARPSVHFRCSAVFFGRIEISASEGDEDVTSSDNRERERERYILYEASFSYSSPNPGEQEIEWTSWSAPWPTNNSAQHKLMGRNYFNLSQPIKRLGACKCIFKTTQLNPNY